MVGGCHQIQNPPGSVIPFQYDTYGFAFSIWVALVHYIHLEMNVATVTSVCFIQVLHTRAATSACYIQVLHNSGRKASHVSAIFNYHSCLKPVVIVNAHTTT